MTVTTEQIKSLRDETGISVMQVKNALEEAGGDKEKALEILKSKGAHIAQKKSDRSLGAGVVASYIHATGTVGSMIEIFCETDFVAKNDAFKSLAYDIAMQVAAVDPTGDGEDAVKTLLAQNFIKDDSQTINALIENGVQKFGERIEIGRIARYAI
jgi:elongation factor Ts